MEPQGINWEHILIEGAVYIIPVLIAGYLGYRKMMWLLGEYRPHRHDEKDGMLTVDGITYPRSMNGNH